jgi:hypothetical protein
MGEEHSAEIESVLLYISEARRRAERARTALEAAGAPEHAVAALRESEEALAAEHRALMQKTLFAVDEAQETLTV